jgi:hypothetical protein
MSVSRIRVLQKAVREVRRHGPGLLVERFYRRKEILTSPAVECDPAAGLEVHMQVCDRDWLNGFWTLKSFRRQCGAPYRLCLYLDFNVPAEVRGLVESNFPGAEMARHDWLDEQVRGRLAAVAPSLAALWRAHYSPTLYKMVNAWLCARQERVVYLDPDVLFFAPPVEMLEFAGTNAPTKAIGLFNATAPPPAGLADTGGFCLDEADVRRAYGLSLPRDFNAGVGVLRLAGIDWGWLDEVLRTLRWLPDRSLMVDQTCLSLLAAKLGWERLDRARYIYTFDRKGPSTVASHYSGSAGREGFYAEGIPTVRQIGLPGVHRNGFSS